MSINENQKYRNWDWKGERYDDAREDERDRGPNSDEERKSAALRRCVGQHRDALLFQDRVPEQHKQRKEE